MDHARPNYPIEAALATAAVVFELMIEEGVALPHWARPFVQEVIGAYLNNFPAAMSLRHQRALADNVAWDLAHRQEAA